MKFPTFEPEPGSCGPESGGHCGPHGLQACLALCVGPQWPELANTCLGLLPACVGTVPCTWHRLHTANLSVFYFPHQSPISHTFVRAGTQWVSHWGGCPTLPSDRARDVEHTCPTPISQQVCSNCALSPLSSFKFTWLSCVAMKPVIFTAAKIKIKKIESSIQ